MGRKRKQSTVAHERYRQTSSIPKKAWNGQKNFKKGENDKKNIGAQKNMREKKG
jgi:hypothetical protein